MMKLSPTFRLLVGSLLGIGTTSIPAQDDLLKLKIIRPAAGPGPLANPLKGWCPYVDPGPIQQPYLMVYHSVSWKELAPVQGKFNFEG